MVLRLLFIFFCMMFSGSCSYQNKELYKTVEYWNGRKLKMPDLQAKIEGRDTIWEKWKQSKFLIFHYIDTSGCTSCRLRLYEWKRFIENMDRKYTDVSTVFVLALKDYKNFELIAKNNYFNIPVLYDDQNRVNILNSLPKNNALQTFLLDEERRVIAIGDPIINPSMENLFYKIIEEYYD